jgi:hypothetical protein
MKITIRPFVAAIILSLVAIFCFAIAPQDNQKPDPWKPLRFLIGSWEGTGKGKPGTSRVDRDYQFTLKGKFIQVRNRSVYPPQDKNPKGENHEDWGMLSYDSGRRKVVFRQFHIEGFVSQYVMESPAEGETTLVFQTESIENIPSGWRARETYRIISDHEFVEIFELAGPGKEFEVYTENHFKRKHKLFPRNLNGSE